jgi:hypothetical protein
MFEESSDERVTAITAVAHVGVPQRPAEARLYFSNLRMRGQAAKHGGTKFGVSSKHTYSEIILLRPQCELDKGDYASSRATSVPPALNHSRPDGHQRIVIQRPEPEAPTEHGLQKLAHWHDLMPSIWLSSVGHRQVSARGNQRRKTIFHTTADTHRRKIVGDRKSRLTQEPQSPDTGLPVSLLSPHGFIICLAGPLDLHSDLMFAFLGENVSRPLLARRTGARYLGRRGPAVSTSCLDYDFLQLQMPCERKTVCRDVTSSGLPVSRSMAF